MPTAARTGERLTQESATQPGSLTDSQRAHQQQARLGTEQPELKPGTPNEMWASQVVTSLLGPRIPSFQGIFTYA